MGVEEIKNEAVTEEEDVSAETSAEDALEDAEPKKKKVKKWPIIVGVILVVFIGLGIGGWVWHEQPSFCNAICHSPMDPYNMTFDFVSGEAGEDKWGNAVADARGMLAVTHREEGMGCLDCHVTTLEEQISEAQSWITNSYETPLKERTLKDLTRARDVPDDEFCLNDSCHHVSSSDGTRIMTRGDLDKATEDMQRNPHEPRHGHVGCGECHKAHRASVNYCAQPLCHGDYDLPDGWLTFEEGQALK